MKSRHRQAGNSASRTVPLLSVYSPDAASAGHFYHGRDGGLARSPADAGDRPAGLVRRRRISGLHTLFISSAAGSRSGFYEAASAAPFLLERPTWGAPRDGEKIMPLVFLYAHCGSNRLFGHVLQACKQNEDDERTSDRAVIRRKQDIRSRRHCRHCRLFGRVHRDRTRCEPVPGGAQGLYLDRF